MCLEVDPAPMLTAQLDPEPRCWPAPYAAAAARPRNRRLPAAPGRPAAAAARRPGRRVAAGSPRRSPPPAGRPPPAARSSGRTSGRTRSCQAPSGIRQAGLVAITSPGQRAGPSAPRSRPAARPGREPVVGFRRGVVGQHQGVVLVGAQGAFRRAPLPRTRSAYGHGADPSAASASREARTWSALWANPVTLPAGLPARTSPAAALAASRS
jgi:hypothetical protein